LPALRAGEATPPQDGRASFASAILMNSAPLDDREWEVMRTHPQLGYDLLSKPPMFSLK